MERRVFLKTPRVPSEVNTPDECDVEADSISDQMATGDVPFRWKFVAPRPDARDGALDDDRKSYCSQSGRRSASCYSSASCSRHPSAGSQVRRARLTRTKSAPVGGPTHFIDAMEEEERNLRKEAERARRGEDRTIVDDFSDVFSAEMDDDDGWTSEDDNEEETTTPRAELSRLVYKRACSKLGIVPVSFFCHHLQSTHLTMKRHILGPKGTSACATALVLNTSVQHLDLSDNAIGDLGAGYLSQMLSENLYITTLILADNGLTSTGLQALCSVLLTNVTVRNLDLSGNHFHENDAAYISELLKENTTIHEFYLRHNDFRERGGEHIAGALVKNSSLVVLDLSWNHLRRKGAVAISESLEKNDSLRVLRVAWNGWYLEGCRALGKALGSNSTLVELDLGCNRINKDCLLAFLKDFKRNTTVEKLCIGSNPLTAEGALVILETLKEVPPMAIHFIDISSQSVNQRFIAAMGELRESRPLTVIHGVVFQHEDIKEDDDSLLDEDPMMVLMEFMKQRNMRLVDLFQSLDTDGSKSLTREEFRAGLLGVNIPMSATSFDKLMKKLDEDGDGEVDFSELMDGQKEYKKKLMRLQKKQVDGPDQETDLQRIQRKISEILAAKAKQVEADKKKLIDRVKLIANTVIAAQAIGNRLRKVAETAQEPTGL